jgi:N-acetylmuramic acid 6-phosphate (MurNAc-6-P) etherase
LKLAIAMSVTGAGADEARRRLADSGGRVGELLAGHEP